MRSALLPLAALILLAACDARTVTTEVDPEKATFSRNKFTELCFATFGRADGGSFGDVAKSQSVTNVPCTDKVMFLVPRSQGGTGNR